MKNEIEENNTLIARFMGIKEQQGFYYFSGMGEPYWFTQNEFYKTEPCSLPDSSFDDFIENSHYHDSWDWLMPVVKNITHIAGLIGHQSWYDIKYRLIEADMESVYKHVIEFIKKVKKS